MLGCSDQLHQPGIEAHMPYPNVFAGSTRPTTETINLGTKFIYRIVADL